MSSSLTTMVFYGLPLVKPDDDMPACVDSWEPWDDEADPAEWLATTMGWEETAGGEPYWKFNERLGLSLDLGGVSEYSHCTQWFVFVAESMQRSFDNGYPTPLVHIQEARFDWQVKLRALIELAEIPVTKHNPIGWYIAANYG